MSNFEVGGDSGVDTDSARNGITIMQLGKMCGTSSCVIVGPATRTAPSGETVSGVVFTGGQVVGQGEDLNGVPHSGGVFYTHEELRQVPGLTEVTDAMLEQMIPAGKP